MEDRKRAATHEADDGAPPPKRQITAAVNGTSKKHRDDDFPGKDDLEKFQKDAIHRQMLEYKREKTTLENRVNELTKRSAHHDDHLRAVDAWFAQLLDEVKLVSGKAHAISDFEPFVTTLLSSDNANFDKYLKQRSSAISTVINDLFKNGTRSTLEVTELQSRIASLLATEKKHVNEMQKIQLEKDQIEERLETASMRYMVAEKKLDRAKSQAVAKLERQATAGGRSESGSGLGGGVEGSGKGEAGSDQGVSGEALVAAETARKAAVAISEKQREQLTQLETDNAQLNSLLTSLKIKLTHLTDEDFVQSDLFKQFKIQHEEVVKRVNDLEATNLELRSEAERASAERQAYRTQLESEYQSALNEKESLLLKVETDVARIRMARDELQADLHIRKATQDQERLSISQVSDLAASREERIRSLEAELERHKVTTSTTGGGTSAEESTPEELRANFVALEQKYAMLNQELSSMGNAYKKVSTQWAQKVNNLKELEEKVSRLSADKSKADQKYFAAMKAKEARDQEIRTLRALNFKSSDIVSQLKDTESTTRTIVVNMEKTLAEKENAVITLGKQYHACQQQVNEKSSQIESIKRQLDELRSQLATKDSACASANSSQRKADAEVEKLKVDLADMEKRVDTWKSKGLGNQNEHYESLRNLAICNVCRKNFKDTAITTCGHVFCKECVEDRISNRMRKCPNCNKSFGNGDYLKITL